jgi:hypothetical protein
MPHASFNVDHLDISSALQLTLWPARPELGELTAAAFSAFGTDEQAIDLHTGWGRLIAKLGWNPNDLSQANAPAIIFYPSADPDMSLLGPPYWV